MPIDTTRGRARHEGRTAAVVLIGGGPRSALILERLAANRPELFAGPLAVHVVEPHRPGSGRIWRQDQSPLLKLNSLAADVTMFTDESVQCAGPAVAGPGLVEWARGVADGSIQDVPVPDEDLARQLRSLGPTTFPTRRLQALYLEWFFRRAADALGPQVPVTVHRDHAVEVSADDGGYQVRLASATVLRADAVVVAVGHTDAAPEDPSAAYAEFAARHRLFHAPPAYTNDVDFTALRPGQEAIVSGMGLAFIDLMVLLMEGRGGRFVDAEDGTLRYIPSGNEPVLWAGSRRGVPYRSKIGTALRGEPAAPPRYLTAGAVAALLEEHGRLDFRQHLWPLLAKDAALGYYRELFTGHPERVALPWSDFLARFDAAPWYSEERRAGSAGPVGRAHPRLPPTGQRLVAHLLQLRGLRSAGAPLAGTPGAARGRPRQVPRPPDAAGHGRGTRPLHGVLTAGPLHRVRDRAHRSPAARPFPDEIVEPAAAVARGVRTRHRGTHRRGVDGRRDR